MGIEAHIRAENGRIGKRTEVLERRSTRENVR